MGKHLDSNGLLYLWSKIKGAMPKKLSELLNDTNFITAEQVPEGATASSTTPKMAGTAAEGTEGTFARGDHVHPHDTSKVDKVSGKGLSANDLTNALKSNYDAAYTHSMAAHAPAGATTLAGYNIGDAYTKAEIDQKLVSAVTYKGERDSFAELPTEGNKIGDMWNVKTADDANGVKAGDNLVWNGTAWDNQGGTVNLEGYIRQEDAITNAEIDAIVAS